MTRQQDIPHLTFRNISRAAPLALATAIVLALAVMLASSAQAQTYSVVYSFGNYGVGGANPQAGLTMDAAGNLYGTTELGGPTNQGTVFKLSPKGSGWLFSPLYSFTGSDGEFPQAPVTIGPDGALYGITLKGGKTGCGFDETCGTVFKLTPAVTACKTALCPWTESVLYSFTGGNDGGNPTGNLMFDAGGNIYGTTESGGANNAGTVFKLTPSGGGWAESVLYSFNGEYDGQFPQSGVISDQTGDLYGTAISSGLNNYGTVFELTPTGSGWTLAVLRSLTPGSDGAFPIGGLIFDPAGNLYGTTGWAGPNGGGTVFELSPSDGNWTFSLLSGLTYYGSGSSDTVASAGRVRRSWNASVERFTDSGDPGPQASLLMDAAGNLYGTTYADGPQRCGTVFRLTPSGSGWTYTSLHNFTCGSDGGSSFANLVMDADGNLYGTTSSGGAYNKGVIFEITP